MRYPKTLSNIMLEVIIALVPAILSMIYFYGANYLILIFTSIISAVLSEAIFLKMQGREPNVITSRLKDLSAVVTAILISLCLPPCIPWYLLSFGTIFAIVIAKHLYGGIGQNIFNPAMVGYCVLLISFPALFTSWPLERNIENYDAITSATPLETIKSQTKNNQSISLIKKNSPEIFQSWFIINFSYLIGGIFLIIRKIITVGPSFSFLTSISFLSLICSYIWPELYPDVGTTLFSGGTMMAAFFIITDPVTMPASFKNKLIYSASIAAITFIIRTFAGYPDGIAFAVILMNSTVPLLDKINIPKPFGVK